MRKKSLVGKMPTDRQIELLTFCRDYLQRFDCFPSIRTIAKAFGWTSTNAVRSKMILLQKRELIETWKDDFGGKGWRFTRVL